ncbi:hypothetical protein MF621_004094 (plasmid) [Bacillus velezensis]|uniref:hypothetical protein n=1 Tax=Bacillus velezensis TaxID=492670 RepID=UPI0004A13B74|nr:hypothetical protein [Bacillus velezensis]KDN91290.1 hypothetical protein EF87_19585 [Bacillus amyloliquefaciens]URJ76387.1 hypothetical protein MF619_004132 [Bacillus velezensis]URJ80343.1 hypothetical protein MF621_004094 [Bacillus velezensis]
MSSESQLINGSDVICTIGGKVIGSFQCAKVEVEREVKSGDSITLFNKEFSCTLKNVEVNKEFEGKILPYNKTYNLFGTVYKLPRGKELPKKKRIRKKWMKKYRQDFRLDNCILG